MSLNISRTLRKVTINKIILDKDNRMLRFGFGKHDGKWFIRFDLWFIGYRIQNNKQNKN